MRKTSERRVGAAAFLALTTVSPAVAAGPFSEESAAAGLDFVHFNGMSGKHYLLEVMGSGAALFDYDNDGDLDVYLVQSGTLGTKSAPEPPLFPPPAGTPPGDRLYRNDLALTADGTVRLAFTDVTASSGVSAEGYGMGVAVGDYDNDGQQDLYVTNFGPNQLLRNLGDGTFADVTAASGADDSRWSVPAIFFDYDGDGWQDLWIGNYVDFRFGVSGLDHYCPSETGAPDYCGPLAYQPVADSLLRNRGDGTFEDATRRGGLLTVFGGALGVAAADFDRDGTTDLYVANDMTPNQLWLNQGNGSFRNEAVLAGCAVNWEGKPEASMGVAVDDFDFDGDADIFMTHLTGETNTLYVNDGDGFFTDRTLASGLANPSWRATGFGTVWLDFDGDGDLDLLAVNGAVRKVETLVDAGDPFPLHQPNQLFRNLGDGRFEEVDAAGTPLALSEVSRGAALGDLDNDGATDVVITNNNGPARLLRNRPPEGRRWLGLRLEEGEGGEAIATRGELTLARRRSRRGGSYASAHDPRILLTLGEGDGPDTLTVVWPSGRRGRWPGLAPDRYYVLPEDGRGRAE